MTKILLAIDIQPSFVRRDIDYVKRVHRYIATSNYNYIYATTFLNYEKSNFINILNWDKVMEFEKPMIEYDRLIIKHGYGIDDYSVLQRNNIHYDICGLDTEACVYKVALDLFDRCYDFSVLENLCQSSGGLLTHNSAITCLERSIGKALIK